MHRMAGLHRYPTSWERLSAPHTAPANNPIIQKVANLCIIDWNTALCIVTAMFSGYIDGPHTAIPLLIYLS
jgi:hypothetical protein